MLSQVLGGLHPVWETSHQILKVFLAFQFFWFFKMLYNSLNTTSCVSRLFADFPLRVALLNYDFMSIKLWSLAFWIGWWDWNLVLCILSSFQWIMLMQHVHVMLKHVLHKPTISCQNDCCEKGLIPFLQQSFWCETAGQIHVLAMTLIGVPFHLGLSVRRGHTKYFAIFFNIAYKLCAFSACFLIKRLRNNYICSLYHCKNNKSNGSQRLLHRTLQYI